MLIDFKKYLNTIISVKLINNMSKIFNIFKITCIFILILFMVFFSIRNSDLIKINFDFFPFSHTIEIRVFLLIIFCFCTGFLCGISATSYSLILKYIENFKEKRKNKKLQKDLEKSKTEIQKTKEELNEK